MPIEPTIIEPDIQRIGRELAEGSAGFAPSLFNRRWWSNTLLDWSMKDDDFKVRLFRFIDVLPTLRDDGQIAKLLDEYFGDMPSLAAPLQWSVRAVSATRLGARLSAISLRTQIDQMARTFIAGDSAESALPVLSRLWTEGRAYSMDLLGEASVSEAEADHYRDRCLAALTLLGRATAGWPGSSLLEHDHLGPIPRVNLSIKLSALNSQLNPIDPEGGYRGVARRLRPLLDLAASLPAAITFDMEQAEMKDLTLMIFMRLLSESEYILYPHGGIAIQAYLKDTATDLDRLIGWAAHRPAPITVRLVKGAYWDSEIIRYGQRGWPVPVWQSKAETDANYETLTRRMLDHLHHIRPAFGTHSLRSLAHAEAAAQKAGVSAQSYEYQMIFGMAEPLQRAVSRMGRRIRLYTPVGELIPGMAYLVRRLLENTANESFLRKEDSQPLDLMLAAPRSRTSTAAPDQQNVEIPAVPLSDRFLNEPHTDFSKAPARAAMGQALAHVKAQLGHRFSYWAPSQGPLSEPEILVSYNPSNPTEVIGELPAYATAGVAKAVETGLARFAAWRATPVSKRADILIKAAAEFRRRRFELAAWEVYETGKPWREADADVAEAIDFLEFYARDMRRLDRPRRLGQEPGEVNVLMFSPRGVAAVIAPWNFPLAIPIGMVSAALVTGNAVLFKPSERALVTGVLLVELLREAGIPDGVLQVLPGGPDIGRALALHPDVSMIAFTGSKEAGLEIMAQSSTIRPGQQAVKRVIAEMGGKNAIIVDDTADLDEAVTGVVSSFTGYQGQKCSACSRAIVHQAVYDLFLQRLADAVMSLRIGPPEDPGHIMGPMIDAKAAAKVQQYIEIGKREGRLIVERQVPGPGHFVGPAIFADIEPAHRLAQEEVFGPVLAVLRAREFSHALELANASPYALTGGVYSRSPSNLLLARELFDVGNLYINRPITGALVGRQPFGGHRMSGIGSKAGGEDYLTQFMVPRVVTENTLRRGFAPSETE